ncbi:MAG: hypothetical protein IKR23_01870 [Lachnospiraceae bacterium]|nr:hypothetical protein [Lachnospiraceae bacterium]
MKNKKRFIPVLVISILCISLLYFLSDGLINKISDKDTYVEDEFGHPCFRNTLSVTTLNVSSPVMKLRAFLSHARIVQEGIINEDANIRYYIIEFKIDKTAEELQKIRDKLSKKYWVGDVSFYRQPTGSPNS